MRDDFGIVNIVPKKVCLTYEQVLDRDLPQTFDIKTTSSRYKKFAKKYGDRAHELESLPTAERSRLLEQAIEEVMDIEAFNAELEVEREDVARIEKLRKQLRPAILSALDS